MRTKDKEGIAKATPARPTKIARTPNGNTPHGKTPQTTQSRAAKSPTAQPAQPTELSEKDRARLREWLEVTDRPFEVYTVPLSRKRKRKSVYQLQTQDDLFEPRLSVQYEVKPRDKWESLRRYKKFTVGSESIATGECILVKHDDSDNPKMDTASQWKAKVLEVRALDPEHVYIRLSWLNRPEDLDKGRKDYHGANELIPTNQMDVIDAMAVNGVLEVERWDEFADDDEKSMPGEDEYFWRQTFDFGNTKTFSKLRQICVDNAPQNPDELIVQCSNGDCRKWMHVRCIAENALARALEAEAAPKRSSKTPRKMGKIKNPASNTAVAVARNPKDGRFKTRAEVYVKGFPDRSNDEPAKENEIVITTESREQYSEDVCCLFCGTEMVD